MPTPDFVLSLREKIGHELLWLPGVAGVVLNQEGEVLLGKRADTGIWTTITGILDPGEEPAQGLKREVLEETGVEVQVQRLLEVSVTKEITFPNQDKCQFLSLGFQCRYLSGEAHAADDESSEVSWFSPENLPELGPQHARRVQLALDPQSTPHFMS